MELQHDNECCFLLWRSNSQWNNFLTTWRLYSDFNLLSYGSAELKCATSCPTVTFQLVSKALQHTNSTLLIHLWWVIGSAFSFLLSDCIIHLFTLYTELFSDNFTNYLFAVSAHFELFRADAAVSEMKGELFLLHQKSQKKKGERWDL